MIDPVTGERRPRRVYDVRLDHGSRDRPKSYEGPREPPSREQTYAEADEIVERMIQRGVIAPREPEERIVIRGNTFAGEPRAVGIYVAPEHGSSA